jgi:hypothetical protein
VTGVRVCPIMCASEVCQIVSTDVLSAHGCDTCLYATSGRRTAVPITPASCVVSAVTCRVMYS